MTAIVIRILTCDGTDDGEVCDAELTAPDGVQTISSLRTVAYRQFGWSTRGRDLCPAHKDGAA